MPNPSCTVKFSRPVVQSATARGTRWNTSPLPKRTAIITNMVNWRFPLLLRIIKIPIVITENKYTVSNKVSTIACIISILILKFYMELCLAVKAAFT